MITQDQCWLKDTCSGIYCKTPTCMRFIKLNKLYDFAHISLKQRKSAKLGIYNGINSCDTESYTHLSEIARNIVDFGQGPIEANGKRSGIGQNLYIYSTNVGNGKTEWALKLLHAYFNQIWPYSELKCKALFINVPQFLLALKDNISHESEEVQYIKDNILDCDLVIFDELGAKVATQFELDHLLTYINARLNNGKTCIYTSNIRPEHLDEYLGNRLASRVRGLSDRVEFNGVDMRGVVKQ